MSHGRVGAAIAASLLMLFAAAGGAEACAVCFQAKSDASRIAFIATTAFLTILPLALLGCGAWWVRRKFADAETRDEPAGSLTPESASNP